MTNEPPEFRLDHPCGLAIRRGLDESAAEALPDARRRDMLTGHVWYDLPQADIHGTRVAMSVCFVQRQLTLMQCAVADPALYGASWDDWSEAKERLRAHATERWLADAGYPVGTYSWGEVWARYHDRDASGGGGITFTTPRSE
ncbi:MAG: hypothetical protein ABIY52_08675 [Gemmatimonadaceae bacterium]